MIKAEEEAAALKAESDASDDSAATDNAEVELEPEPKLEDDEWYKVDLTTHSKTRSISLLNHPQKSAPPRLDSS